MIALIVLMPLLLTALVVGYTVTDIILKLRSDGNACRRLTLNTQLRLVRPLSALLELNKKATRLRAQNLRAQNALKKALASGQPVAIAAATAVYAKVQAERTALRAEQELYWLEAKRIYWEFKKELATFNSAEEKSPPRALALRTTPALDLTPNYIPEEPFRAAQAYKVQGQISFSKKVSNLLKPLGLNQIAPIPYTCGASLIQKGATWEPVLEAGKF
jgi:hypothetical protein